MWSFHRSDILIIVFQIYFSADLLFPWAIFYLYVLQAISDVPCSSSWFDNIDFDYDEFRAERDTALIRYFVQLLLECALMHLPPDAFHAVWDYTRTFAHTEFYISYLDLYLEWLCHYRVMQAKSRETRISLLLMLFLELTPNWATISMKTARLHRTLLTNTVIASLEKSTGIGLSGKSLPLAIPPNLFYTYTTSQERHYVRRGVPMRF